MGTCSRLPAAESPIAVACTCPREYQPACDTLTGKTYFNRCEAHCDSVRGIRLLNMACPAKAASEYLCKHVSMPLLLQSPQCHCRCNTCWCHAH